MERLLGGVVAAGHGFARVEGCSCIVAGSTVVTSPPTAVPGGVRRPAQLIVQRCSFDLAAEDPPGADGERKGDPHE